MKKAIGLIEVIGLTQAIVAADEAVKSASVKILGLEKVSGGIVTVKLIGDVSAVSSAVEASKSIIEHSGVLRGIHVIPRMHEDVLTIVNGINPETDIKNKNPEKKNSLKNKEDKENLECKEVSSKEKIIKDINDEKVSSKNKKVIKVEETCEIKIEAKEDLAKKELSVSQNKKIVSQNKKEEVINVIKEINRETLLKMTVKELRRLAITLKPEKTSNKIKYLKKEELISVILKAKKEEGRN